MTQEKPFCQTIDTHLLPHARQQQKSLHWNTYNHTSIPTPNRREKKNVNTQKRGKRKTHSTYFSLHFSSFLR